ncbi:MAG: orotate phosphoribosyltransferase-like protein [Candidatus Poseidoniia archaeon]|nr:orotate phosphoribosyltransferase-like protein [Candidatus Poseidoniia archaeon]MDP6658533.1 orotate phosphoribosyltransferase-like protein [Candidatus Poseidoniia archaeon]MDP6846173.1 orotate phosphoribosyltransferase-like protein [Candidatus Poseidoniia archaeon]MDP7007446.1 orotate phosphoribosyltransferase-like protein [Candidatus Poseidoniia archaeon]
MSIESLSERADELREKGLSTREICQELHLSRATVEWLLAKQASEPGERPPADVKAGWRTIGVSGFRMRATAEIMADIILEEQEKHDFDVEVVAGVMANGVPLGTLISELLEVDFAMVRPSREDTSIDFASNFAGLKDKQVVIIDDVVSSGTTSREVIEFIKQEGGEPVLVIVVINKRAENELDGVPLRALVRARPVGT